MIDAYGVQQGVEDVSRRLRAYGPERFVHHLQEDEFDDFRAGTAPEGGVAKAFLIHNGSNGQLADTVAVVAGTRVAEIDRIGEAVFYAELLFAGRPVWAAGEDWIAIGHGDSTSIVVRSLEGEMLARLAFPTRREHVSEEDRLEAARWGMAIRVVNNTNSREISEKASRRQRQEGVLRLEPPAESALRLDRHGAAVRDFDDRWAYVLFRDDDGSSYVQRYRMPEMACDSGRRHPY